ncbi:putative RNA-binding protein [Schistosoma japonicum]|uniref:Putative RNA-binding protein n=1 Tax=Schistosoma japonicum TaxID=6182 RepID=A0A4Z2DXP9_SCHJA|nr:putative RNA-binding protein [Schistosoma japonicum]
MRRHADQDFSPPSKRHRDRSGYTERHRSVSHTSPGSRSKYSLSNRHSSRSKNSTERVHGLGNSRTLCVKNISSKLSVDVVEQYVYRELGKYGDLSINVGHLGGERVALVTFKHSGDAQEALCDSPTIYIHDRAAHVTSLTDLSSEGDTRKVITSKKRQEEVEVEDINDHRYLMHNISSKLESNFSDFLPKPTPLGPSGTTSLLGMPGVTSSAMMAAAAKALGLNAVPGVLPPPQLSTGNPQNRFESANLRHYEHNRNGFSAVASDSERESKATRTLFVGSLEPDITEKEVLSAFERYGYVEQIDIKRSPKPGAHSYAFVRFQNVDMASRAKLSMSGRCVRSLNCKIGYGKAIPSHCLYISGLESWTSVDSLQRILIRFGQLTYLDWFPRRKYAIAMYDSCESALEANRQLKIFSATSRPNLRLRVDFISPEFVQPKIQILSKTDSNMESDGQGNQISESRNAIVRPDIGIPLNVNSCRIRPNEHFSGGSYTMNHYGIEDTDRDKNPTSVRHLPHIKPSFHMSNRYHLYRNTPRCSDKQGIISSVEVMPTDPKSIITLQELDQFLQPELWKGKFLLKNDHFYFRCLMLIGNKEIGEDLLNYGGSSINSERLSCPTLRISRRGTLDASWMAEATHRIHNVLSTAHHNLCLMLILPDVEQTNKSINKESKLNNPSNSENANISTTNHCYSLHALVAYLKLKQSAGIISLNREKEPPQGSINNDNPGKTHTTQHSSLIVYLFAPSSFALSLLKQTAPCLSSDLATTNDYMVLLALKR